MQRIIKKYIILSFVLATVSSGCVYLIIGGIGALGGYVVSPDTVEGITGHDPLKVWEASNDIISAMGTISEENQSGGMIIARVTGAKVTITIATINQSTVRLTVKARKAFVPKISIAQEVFVKIVSRLNE